MTSATGTRLSCARLSCRYRQIVYSTGSTSRVKNALVRRPPTMGAATRFMTSAPAPSDQSEGEKRRGHGRDGHVGSGKAPDRPVARCRRGVPTRRCAVMYRAWYIAKPLRELLTVRRKRLKTATDRTPHVVDVA